MSKNYSVNATILQNINDEWISLIQEELNKPYFFDLDKFLSFEKENFTIYPPDNQIFSAFEMTKPQDVKVVILGQDPYHGAGQAHGLSFSVPRGIKPPPSLVNIFKELNSDLGIKKPADGNLNRWASQGVLLLNATLTVREGIALSHNNRGWETFTDAIIKKLSENYKNIVFLLWGKRAQDKIRLIDTTKHHILTAAHPSPLSAYNGFFGCKHFSRTNQYLESNNISPIDWAL